MWMSSKRIITKRRKWFLNNKFFCTPSHKLAYIMGFFFADASLCYSGRGGPKLSFSQKFSEENIKLINNGLL